MKHKNTNGFYSGFTDSSISHVHENLPEYFEDLFLLISCLDSGKDFVTSSKFLSILTSNSLECEILSNCLLISPCNTEQLFRIGKIFTHFDEIYLFKKKPTDILRIEQSFTTDGYNFGSNVPNEFIDIFKKVGAVRYLSDGCGLNFACESVELVRKLELIS